MPTVQAGYFVHIFYCDLTFILYTLFDLTFRFHGESVIVRTLRYFFGVRFLRILNLLEEIVVNLQFRGGSRIGTCCQILCVLVHLSLKYNYSLCFKYNHIYTHTHTFKTMCVRINSQFNSERTDRRNTNSTAQLSVMAAM